MTTLFKVGAISSLCCLGLAVVATTSMADAVRKIPGFGAFIWSNATLNIINRVQDAILSVPDEMVTYASLGLGCVVLYHLYQLLFVPSDRVRLLGDLGYVPEGRRSMKETANLVRRRRKVGNIPSPYPNGWYSVLESRDLKKAEAKAISVLGLDLALFRADDGRAHIIDAYCSHIGAHLGVGGLVKGSCLECPFHGWKFRGEDGKCVHVPYAVTASIPDNAHLKAYNTLELNGFIYIWYHAEGIDPNWVPPELEEITSGYLRYGGRSEHEVNAHIEEVTENAADLFHLAYLHGPIMSAGTDLRYTHDGIWSWASHTCKGSWADESVNPHIGVMRLKHCMNFFGFNTHLLDVDIVVRQFGPGISYITFEYALGKGVFLLSVTPSEPIMQRLIQHVYFQWNMPVCVGKFLLYGNSMMVERDIMVWNNKKYEAKPVWIQSEEDEILVKHRRWFSQFYSENSKRLNFQKDSLDW